ncbi:hypothetical protein RDI58_016968 [Solanum bulbocastanum]|uniref:S-adenosyl-L-methionine-dependent methyltransferase n=1 Tax=Solanum bulbocastanum TaxID=147425 RepID=A0AAN8YGJ5_SOLBU
MRDNSQVTDSMMYHGNGRGTYHDPMTFYTELDRYSVIGGAIALNSFFEMRIIDFFIAQARESICLRLDFLKWDSKKVEFSDRGEGRPLALERMEVLRGRVHFFPFSTQSTYFSIRARASFKVQQENDPFFKAAIERASLRFRESHSPDPLLIDPYVGCLLPCNSLEDMDQELHPYCLATKFIDDKLLETMQTTDGLKQVVLLTDGLDTRPYRLNWPTSTLVFDICPDKVFRGALQKLQDAGAKIPRGCMSFHVPSESFDVENILCSKGFSGTRPSIWAFQGLPVVNLESFKDILSTVSNLAMKGCLFLGELPVWLAEMDVGDRVGDLSAIKKWLDDLFMSYGFRVKMIEYDEVARNLRQDSAKRVSEVSTSILFIAEHLRFSDDQMETWRTEFQRIEEEGDEEGFEEL